MKKNRLVLTALIALGGLIAFGPALQAQEKKTDDKAAQGEARQPGARQGGARQRAGGQGGATQGGARQGRRQDQLARMKEQLSVTAEQEEKLKPVLKDRADKLQALRQDTNLAAGDRRKKTQEIQEGFTAKLKTILTPEQVEKWQKFQQGQRRGQRQGGQQGQRPRRQQ